jgi:hypothetical protein
MGLFHAHMLVRHLEHPAPMNHVIILVLEDLRLIGCKSKIWA